MTGIQATKLVNMVIDYLQSNGNLAVLPEVIRLLKDKSVGLGLQDSAVITSAVKLDTTELKAISEFISTKYGQELNIVQKLDPSLIAGFTIKIGDEVIDSSLSAKLDNIRKELL